jgi:hypothetical protein
MPSEGHFFFITCLDSLDLGFSLTSGRRFQLNVKRDKVTCVIDAVRPAVKLLREKGMDIKQTLWKLQNRVRIE